MYRLFAPHTESTLPATTNRGWEISAVSKGQDRSCGVD